MDEPLAPEAYHGLIGEFVSLVAPHTEADPAALAGSILVASGNHLTRSRYYLADGSKHYGNEFLAIVGDTSKGRKGTSWNRVKDVIEIADPDYFTSRLLSPHISQTCKEKEKRREEWVSYRPSAAVVSGRGNTESNRLRKAA